MKIPHLALLVLLLAPKAMAQAPGPAGVKALRDLAYVEGGSERQKLDLYLPEKAAAPLPLVIWIHGGGWAAGDKAGCPALRMPAQGYAAASLNYRLSGDALFPAQIEDCKAAIRWLRAHAKEYNLDPDRFGVWGSSAGGHLVALVGTSGETKDFDKGANLDQPSSVQAVCDFFGPTDFLQMDAHALASAPFKHDAPDSPESRLIGGAIQENKDKVARANPITYVTNGNPWFVISDNPPFLIVHGDKDSLVPHHQSELLFDALKWSHVNVHFHTIHGAGHGTGFAGKDIDDMVSAFFDENLKEIATPRGWEASMTESNASATAPASAQPGTKPPIPWEAILARDDKNGDGKISRKEFSGPPALFDRIDQNHDGFITREEHEAFQARIPGQRPAATLAPAATPKPAGGNP